MFIINKVVFVLNFLCAGALALACLAPFVSPSFFWPFAFLGLGFPFLVLLNFLFVIYWLIFGRLRMILSIAALLAGFGYYTKFFNFSGKHLGQKNESCIKVVSFNARLFGFYEGKKAYPPVFTYLSEDKPDLVCFQEFFSTGNHEHALYNKLKKITGLRYMHFNILDDGRKEGDFGLAIFSKYQVVNKGAVGLDTRSGNGCIFADLKIGNDTVRVYNMHLQSVRFVREDYRFVQSVPTDRDTALYKSKNILKRLRYAFIKRAAQAEKVREHMDNCPYRMIVCGDFNDTPVSYTYRTLSAGLKDAFRESGSGFERTYMGPFPSFRIDHILFDPSFEGYGYRNVDKFLSDHKLIETTIKLKP